MITRGLGATLSVAGAAGWVLTLDDDTGGPGRDAVRLAAVDLRWAAIVLGLGGLLLLVRRARPRRTATLLAVAGWLVLDLVWSRAGAQGSLAAALAAASALLVLGGAAWLGHVLTPDTPVAPAADADPGPVVTLPITYAAVAIAVAPVALTPDRLARDLLPPPLRVLGEVVAVALVVAAVLVAATATARPWWSRLGLGVVGLAILGGLGLHLVGPPGPPSLPVIVIPTAVYLATLPVAALVTGRPRRWGLVVLGSLGAPVVLGAVTVLATLATAVAPYLAGRPEADAVTFVPTAVILGLTAGPYALFWLRLAPVRAPVSER